MGEGEMGEGGIGNGNGNGGFEEEGCDLVKVLF